MELENDLTLLENQRRAFQRSKDHYRHTLSYCEENMPILEKRLSKYEGDIQQSEMSKDQAFSMTVGKQVFSSNELKQGNPYTVLSVIIKVTAKNSEP